jgi:hypothetical protein
VKGVKVGGKSIFLLFETITKWHHRKNCAGPHAKILLQNMDGKGQGLVYFLGKKTKMQQFSDLLLQ